MSLDKPTYNKLRKFAQVFADARDRDVNESDTVMYLVEFFKEVLDYDPLAGELSKEVAINDRYCDFGIRLNDKIAFLVEAKPASVKTLREKHIEQAENYASRAGITWVVLTSGVLWQLYHLTFGAGIEHELVFELNLVDDLEQKPDWLWDSLSVLCKRSVREDSLDAYYKQQKVLNPKNVVNLLLQEEMLMKLRQELNRKAESRLDLNAVFEAVLAVLDKDALAAAGDIEPPTRKRHRRRQRKVDGLDGLEPSDGDSQSPEGEPRPETEKAPAVAQTPIIPTVPAPQAPPATLG